MFKPKQILVPIDFSPAAEMALEDASEIAKNYGAALDVIHVWELPTLVRSEEVALNAGLPATVIDSISQHAHTKMELTVSVARERGIAIRNVRVVPGDAYHTIVDIAAQHDYDLIVIGTHGRKGLARMFLGSVAERVVRHAGCPVLVARTKATAAGSPNTKTTDILG